MNKEKNFTQIISNSIDGMIRLFSPRSAFRRKMFREAVRLSQSFKSYKGAQHGRLKSSWIPGGGSADETLLPELADIRERSRDLNRNDAHASGITGTMTTNVVGSGIRPQSRLDKEYLGISDKQASDIQKQIEKIWKRWIPHADAGERMDFYEIQQLIDRQILENGEAIIIPRMLKDKNRPYSFVLQVVESDRLDSPVLLKKSSGQKC